MLDFIFEEEEGFKEFIDEDYNLVVSEDCNWHFKQNYFLE